MINVEADEKAYWNLLLWKKIIELIQWPIQTIKFEHNQVICRQKKSVVTNYKPVWYLWWVFITFVKGKPAEDGKYLL